LATDQILHQMPHLVCAGVRYLYRSLLFQPRMATVGVGGTFDPVHDGHLALLSRAFELANGNTVIIALTSDEMARAQRTRPVRGFDLRLKDLKDAIIRNFGNVIFKVQKIDDICGSAIHEDFDYIVVSPETEPSARKINEIRAKKGRKPIGISVIEYQMAQDNERISSTRISKGEIDTHGRLKS
jgi:pantetheine-phosphate adenylyltransferase